MSEDPVRQQYIDGSSYPPSRTGLRGSHPGSFDVAHEIRDGRRFDVGDLPVEESYDLVVVGAGISGLASAWFFRQRHPDASILLLDNHDDFGGHAKRNEFTVDGRFLLGYGGSEALQSPEALYGPEAKGMLRALGIDYHRFERYFDTDLYPSLGLSRGGLLCQGGLRRGPARHRRPDADGRRRHPGRSHARAVARGVHRGLPGVGRGARRSWSSSTRRRATLSRPVRGRDDRAPVADQLPRVRAEGLGARRRGGRHVPGAVARLLRDRDRRRLGVRRHGDRLPGFRRDDAHTGSAGGRRDGRAVHLPLPRWERVDRASDRAVADPRGGARRLDGGSSSRPGSTTARSIRTGGRRACGCRRRGVHVRNHDGRGGRRLRPRRARCTACAAIGRSSPATT